MTMRFEDRVRTPRDGEAPDATSLAHFLEPHGFVSPLEIQQYPAGHSNLTYLLKDASGRLAVLRRAPIGANVKSGHDMEREFRVLGNVAPYLAVVPAPLAYCASADVIGAEFYVMSRIEGVILRGANASGLMIEDATMAHLCGCLLDGLVSIHAVPSNAPGIAELGHAQGYVERQVRGWTKRWQNAKTQDVPAMERVAVWLTHHLPAETESTLIHNDYKYDNVVFSRDLTSLVAVLDWEMATVGDPLMDLGTTLAYWVEATDPDFLQAISGPTALPGNMTRRQFAQAYSDRTGRNIDNIVFYYVFGLFKIAVIGQQIFKRYELGLTKDPRFAGLIFAVTAMAERASTAIASETL